MMRTIFTIAVTAGCAVGCLPASAFALGGGSPLMFQARPFAERFLTLLDSGEVAQAYKMLNPDVTAKLAINRLSRLGATRGSSLRGGVSRKFVRVKPLVALDKADFVPMNSVVVCFVENPRINFRSVAYTAVTVSGTYGRMQIDNFQTTSEPISACR